MSMKLKTALKKAAMLIHENDFCRYRFESYDGKSFCALGAIKNTDYDAFMWLSYATHKGFVSSTTVMRTTSTKSRAS